MSSGNVALASGTASTHPGMYLLDIIDLAFDQSHTHDQLGMMQVEYTALKAEGLPSEREQTIVVARYDVSGPDCGPQPVPLTLPTPPPHPGTMSPQSQDRTDVLVLASEFSSSPRAMPTSWYTAAVLTRSF